KQEVEQLIEARLGKVEQAHAEALEKLGKSHTEALEKLEKANTEALGKKDEEIGALKKDLEKILANTPKEGGPKLRVIGKGEDLGKDDPAAVVEPIKKADGSIDQEATAKAQM